MVAHKGTNQYCYATPFTVSGTSVSVGSRTQLGYNYITDEINIAADTSKSDGLCSVWFKMNYPNSSSPKVYIQTVKPHATNVLSAPVNTGNSYIAGYTGMTAFSVDFNPKQNRFYGLFVTSGDNHLWLETWTLSSAGNPSIAGQYEITDVNEGYDKTDVIYNPAIERIILLYKKSTGDAVTLRPVNYDGGWEISDEYTSVGSTNNGNGWGGTLGYFAPTCEIIVHYNNSSDKGIVRPVKITGSGGTYSYTLGTATEYGDSSDTGNYKSFDMVDASPHGAFLTFADNSDGGKPQGRIWNIGKTNLTTENFIGFASAGISSGATGTINILGNSSTQSSLTPGQKYYVQANGTISTTEDIVASVVAGVALSSTKLLIKGN